MPQINSCSTLSLSRWDAFDYMRFALFKHIQSGTFPFPHVTGEGVNDGFICGHSDCRTEFNYYITYRKGIKIICLQYLRDLHSLDDHPRYKKGTNDKK